MIKIPASPASVVFGVHSVNSAVKHHPERVRRLHIDQKLGRRFGVIVKIARNKHIPIQESSASTLARLSSGGVHQGILAEVEPIVDGGTSDGDDWMASLENLTHPPLLLVLDRITDPGNLGACLRNAAAFAVDAVLITRHHSAGLDGVTAKAAAGATETLRIVSVNSLRQTLVSLRQTLGLRLYATTVDERQSTTALPNAGLANEPAAIVLGAESSGVRSTVLKICDECLWIPMSDRVDCLNVSAACAVLLYEAFRQRRSLTE